MVIQAVQRGHLAIAVPSTSFSARYALAFSPFDAASAWSLPSSPPAPRTSSSAAAAFAKTHAPAVVELRDGADSDLGGRYTLKRWRVAKVEAEEGVVEIGLCADNPAYRSLRMRQATATSASSPSCWKY